jgi:hypothetical protein
MVDGHIGECHGWFAIIFIRILYWYSLKYILLFLMDIQDKYFGLTGCQCFIMYFGLVSIVCSLICMSRMQMINMYISIQFCIKLDKKENIFHSTFFGDGLPLAFGMD